MSWPGEKQRHSMSARGVKTGMQTFFSDFNIYPDYPMEPPPIAKSRFSLMTPRLYFEEVFSVQVNEQGDYNPDEYASFAPNRFDSDAQVMGYIDLLQQQGAVVMVEPLAPDRRDEADTMYVTIPKKSVLKTMKIIQQMGPEEFHPIRNQPNTYRLWWD